MADHIGHRTPGVANDDEFLVVRTAAAGTGIEENPTSLIEDAPGQLRVLALALVEPARLRTPD